MSPNDRIVTLQRQIELMQARMEKMRSQRDSMMDCITKLIHIAEQHDQSVALCQIQKEVQRLRQELNQFEIL